jgi:hypothetical protein
VSAPALWLSTAALCAASLGARRASADDEVCRRAYVETQRLQRAAQFQAARRQAVVCGQDVCSETVREQCSAWLESIERALPTLVIDARDGVGAALAEVRVEANGELLAERLNGRALELDPGEYVLRFRYGEQVVEQRTLIREAEKYRRLGVRFDLWPGPPAAELVSVPQPAAGPLPVASAAPGTAPLLSGTAGANTDTPAPIPTASYVLGGVGVASLATFAVLASSGYAEERHLRNTCAGACTSDAVDSVRTRYVVGDLALGVGVTSLIAAAVVWIWAPSDPGATGRLSLGPQRVAFEAEF